MLTFSPEAMQVAAILATIVTLASVVAVLSLLGALNLRDRLLAYREEQREMEFINNRLREALLGWETEL